MKKMLNIIATLTAISISMSTASFVVSATTLTDEGISDSNTLENGYDINNDNYRKKVDSLGRTISHEKEFVAYINSCRAKSLDIEDIEDCATTHVYLYNDDQPDNMNSRTYIFESIVPGTNKKARKFEQMSISWSSATESDANEISAFIEEENLQAKIVTEDGGVSRIEYNDYTNEEEVVTAFLALNKKFGIDLTMYCSDMEHYDVFYDDSLIGDVNIDGEINVRDAANIATMLAQGKADELLITADFNGDGRINVRDAAEIASALAKGLI